MGVHKMSGGVAAEVDTTDQQLLQTDNVPDMKLEIGFGTAPLTQNVTGDLTRTIGFGTVMNKTLDNHKGPSLTSNDGTRKCPDVLTKGVATNMEIGDSFDTDKDTKLVSGILDMGVAMTWILRIGLALSQTMRHCLLKVK